MGNDQSTPKKRKDEVPDVVHTSIMGESSSSHFHDSGRISPYSELPCSDFEPVRSVASSIQLIQELSFSLCIDAPHAKEALSFSQVASQADSSSEDGDGEPLSRNQFTMTGSFASLIPEFDSYEDDDEALNSKVEVELVKKLSIESISIQRLAQHHLYLTGMCLAYARRQEDAGGTTEDILSTDFEHIVDANLGLKEGRPYPAE